MSYDQITSNYKNNQQSWYTKLATTSLSTVGGMVVGGVAGGIIGFSASIADSYLIDQEYTDKHYLSSTAFWTITLNPASFLTNLFPLYNIPIKAGLYGLPLLFSYFTIDFFDFRNKIEIPLNSFITINKFFDEKQIISYTEVEKIYNGFFDSPVHTANVIIDDIGEIYNNNFFNNFIVSNSLNLLNILINNLSLHLLASFSANNFITSLINKHKKELLTSNKIGKFVISSLSNNYAAGHAYLKEGAKIITIFTLKYLIEFIIEEKQNVLRKEQCEMVLDKSTDLILKNDNGRKILSHEMGKEIIQNLNLDLQNLLFNGANKINDLISETSQSLISLNNLIKLAPDAFALYGISLIPMQTFLENISGSNKKLDEKISTIKTQITQVKFDIIENIEQINLRNAEDFIKNKYNLLLNEKNYLTRDSEHNSKLQMTVKKILKTLNNAQDLFYFGFKTFYQGLDVKKIPMIKNSIDNLYSFLSSNINFEINNNDLKISAERINLLFEIVSNKSEGAKRTFNDENKIIFKNYQLKLENKQLVKIDYFEFKPGKHYAITGKSGCGKTSTLIDIKEGVAGKFLSSGEISIGYDKNNIMFIDQKTYLPKESTLLESIYFPGVLQLLDISQVIELRQKIINLLKEIEIDEFSHDPNNKNGLISKLDSKDFKLSGGQFKKLAIIQAIIKNPDVLIADEVYAGLDKNSLFKIEQMINKYLPNVLLLSVDHHAEDNNYNGFYDSEIHFEGGTIIERELASKYYEAPIFSIENEVILSETYPQISFFGNISVSNCYKIFI
jgi:ABC-type lipoprotein export system ATPase subunit